MRVVHAGFQALHGVASLPLKGPEPRAPGTPPAVTLAGMPARGAMHCTVALAVGLLLLLQGVGQADVPLGPEIVRDGGFEGAAGVLPEQ